MQRFFNFHREPAKLSIEHSSNRKTKFKLLNKLTLSTFCLAATLSVIVGSVKLFAQSTSLPVIAIANHPINNNGRIEGSAQNILGESFSVSSAAQLWGDLFVPGTPNVNTNGTPNWNGQQTGSGSPNPAGYWITINSGVQLDHLVTRTDAAPLPAIPAPPNPTGNRYITINSQNDINNIGNWSTVRDLNLNSNVDDVAVPPGTYNNFSANSNAGFVFGIEGSSTPTVYNFQYINFNSNSRLTVVGPIIITVRNWSNISSSVLGSAENSNWLELRSSNGGFNISGNSTIYGNLIAPQGSISLDGTIAGSAAANYLNISSNSVIKPGNVEINQAPEAQDDSYSTAEDTPLIIVAPGVLSNDTDADGDALTATSVSGPTHGNLHFNANGSFTYTPAVNYFGPDSFIYKVSDGDLSSESATVNITVTSVNDPPVALPQTVTIHEDTPLNVPLHASDIDGDELTFILVDAPQHGTINLQPNGHYTYTPDENYHGIEIFTYKVNDGTADSNIATVTITISPVNDTPTAQNANFVTGNTTPLNVALQADDVDNDGLTYVIVTQPQNGTLSGTGPDFIYTANPDFTGTDSFTYKVNDGQADSNIATVEIEVYDADLSAVDALIRYAPENEFIGDEIYNTTGEGQTKTAQVLPGNTLAYYVRVQNQGPTPSAISITSELVGSNAQEILDNWNLTAGTVTGQDVSAQLFGEGFTTPVIAPNQQYQLFIRLQPKATAPLNVTANLLINVHGYGHWSDQTDSVKIEATVVNCIDNIPPTVAMQLPLENGTADSLNDAYGSVYDVGCAGLQKVEIAINRHQDNTWWDGSTFQASQTWNATTIESGNWHYQNGGFSSSNVPPGEYTLYVRAYDNHNNASEIERTVTIIIPTPEIDAQIGSEQQGAYIGEGIIQTNVNPPFTQEVSDYALDSPAVYYLKATNTGNVPGTFRLSNDFSMTNYPGDWEMKIFLDSEDITSQFFPTNIFQQPLAAGQSIEFRIEITPSAALEQGSTRSVRFLSNLYIAGSVVRDVVRTLTIKDLPPQPPNARPDLRFNFASFAGPGNDIYNDSGIGQTFIRPVESGQIIQTPVGIQNDAEFPDSFRIKLSAQEGWNVSVKQGQTDITEDVFSEAGWTTPILQPGQSLTIVLVSNLVDQNNPSHFYGTVLAESILNPNIIDVVKLIYQQYGVPLSYQPDALIEYPAQGYIGNNTYSTTQPTTVSNYINNGETTIVKLAAQNDGAVPQNLILFTPSYSPSWDIHYFDAAGNEITEDMDNGGFVTPLLNPGETYYLELEITPNTVLPYLSAMMVNTEIYSSIDGSYDVVRAYTRIDSQDQ